MCYPLSVELHGQSLICNNRYEILLTGEFTLALESTSLGCFLFFFLFLLFLAVLDLCCCAQAFSSCGERELLFIAVLRLLIAVAFLVAEHRL